MSTSGVIFPAQPEQILKSLGKLWTSVGLEEKQMGKPTVLRASSMTLIVVTDENDQGFSASQTISDLMRSHPSRGIVIMVTPEAEHGLEARVLAQCWKPFGKAQQICCEQIEITARPESWPNVGQTLVGLTVADLPVLFWCRYKRALRSDATREQKAGLQAILALATKVVVDTGDMEAADGFELLHRLRAAGPLVADLEWARLTPWRQSIAQVFDNPSRPTPFSHFKTVEITYAGGAPSPGLLLLAGWLSNPNRARVRWKQTGEAEDNLQAVTLRSDNETITAERKGRECVRLWSSMGPERFFTISNQSTELLLEEELSIFSRDSSFEAAFARGQELLIGV